MVEELRDATWECPDCAVEMHAAAVDPDREFKKAPYFTSKAKHMDDCRGDGIWEDVAPGPRRRANDQMLAAARIPVGLRLAQQRLRVNRVEGEEVAAPQPQNRNYIRPAPDGNDRQRDLIAGTIHRIAEAYATFDIDELPLEIAGCVGNTYGTCFERLGNIWRPQQYPRKIYYAELAFQRFVTNANSIQVFLYPALMPQGPRGEGNQLQRLSVTFDMNDWTDRRRNGFQDDLETYRREQMRLRNENADTLVHLFFLGDQDPGNLLNFVVNDPRLAAFIRMPPA
ncbi:MAG: hypothetical protein E6Q98_01605 [Rhodospirillaceae bacterium]|nr:MAG: hypothetical protein E6Q98_01605 [Rhodospirillaceae bacterium]